MHLIELNSVSNIFKNHIYLFILELYNEFEEESRYQRSNGEKSLFTCIYTFIFC